MSGASRFQVLAIPTAPAVEWIGADGQRQVGFLTPAWYRVITALVARTGGTQGRLTPDSSGDPVLQLFDVGLQESAVVAGQLPLFPDEPRAEAGLGTLPADVPDFGVLGKDFPDSYLQETFGVQWPDPVPEGGLGVYSSPGLPVPPAPEDITPGGSPYTFTSVGRGFALVSGGTVTSITWSRDGSTYYATGQTAGFFPMELTDSLIITYAAAPTLTFIRSAM